MKVEHIIVGALVHRMVTATNGFMTISCDLAYGEVDVDADDHLKGTDAPLTCVACLTADWRAMVKRKVFTQTGRMSSRRAPLLR